MEKMQQVLIVNNNSEQSGQLEKMIKTTGFAGKTRVTLNGGHALLHLSHLYMDSTMEEARILILLKINTPLVDGIEFLQSYGKTSHFRKENIQIAVIDQELTAGQRKKAQDMGCTHFIPCPGNEAQLKAVLSDYFFGLTESMHLSA